MIKQVLQFIEQLRYGMRQSSLPDGFPFWGFTDPLIGDLSVSDRPVFGHTPRRYGSGDWRCTCGRALTGDSRGNGRAAARDAMRIHRLDLNHSENVVEMGTRDAA